MPSLSYTAASLIAGATLASAHGFVKSVIINGETLPAYDVTNLPYQANPDAVIGWATSATDLGFVDPPSYGSSDIICHKDGANAQISATVAAGDTVSLVWNTWPESHKGPVIDYLANCGESCETVDKTSLEFFKIDQAGFEDGTWASDDLIDSALTWSTTIPSGLAAGNYVLRHEIIALHSGNQANGAQNYPQCINLVVTGSGTAAPEGTLGTSLYTGTDEGILFNIYQDFASYPIPGPALASFDGSGSTEPTTTSEASAPTATSSTAADATTAPSTTAASATATSTTAASPTAATSTTVATPASSSSIADVATSQPAATPTGSVKPCSSKRRRRHARELKGRKLSLRH